jgi:hypothetical protein
MIIPEERMNSRRIVLIVLAVLALVEGGMLFYAARQSRTSKPKLHQSHVADQWLGKWIGPEGTYLQLSKSADHYTVLIQSLDGRNAYQGNSTPSGIEFQRDGKTETIHAGIGQDTGMKWLLDKKNCLVIHTGEGFCRD